MSENRYMRQAILPEIGEAGQRRLKEAKVTIVGLGALGSVMAELLARAGVGSLKLIDFDLVEEHNLQRQALYTTEDIGTPKADAAKKRLAAIDPSIQVEAVMEHLETKNLTLLDDADLLLDGTDNMETRLLINERCHGTRPVIFSSAVMDKGSVLPVTGEGACYACLFRKKRNMETCCEHGVLNGATHVAASVAATEAIKLLVGQPVMEGLFSFSLFDSRFELLKARKDPGCPICGREEEKKKQEKK